MRIESHNLHGTGNREHEVYDMPPRRPPVVTWEDRWEQIPGTRADDDFVACGCGHDCVDEICQAEDPADCGCSCEPCRTWRAADAARSRRGPTRVRIERPDPTEPWWEAVTDVPCPVEGCEQVVVWYEAGYVPGYRVCMAPLLTRDRATYDRGSIRHHFQAGAAIGKGNTLIRDDVCET